MCSSHEQHLRECNNQLEQRRAHARAVIDRNATLTKAFGARTFYPARWVPLWVVRVVVWLGIFRPTKYVNVSAKS
jgi:hypothetical protein